MYGPVFAVAIDTCHLRATEAPDHIKAIWSGCSWIVDVISTVMRKGKLVQQAH